MSRDLTLYLDDILTSIHNIQTDTSDLNYNTFTKDRKTKDAVILNLLIIGESTKQIPKTIREQYPQIQWKQIAGMRDIIAHAYFSLNTKIVWGVIQDDLVALKTTIEQIQTREM
jgi:uncharacterized protein with HEPN domain